MRLTRPLARVALLTAAVVAVTAAPATATIPDDDALPDAALEAERYAGEDRYVTAARTALAAAPDGAETVVIARGDAFPDGLAASYLAGAEDAPILLTAPSSLPLITQDALVELDTRRAIIVGGHGAIDESVEDRLVEILGADDVDRIDGSDRFQTAALVFDRVGRFGTLGDVTGQGEATYTTAIVASGRRFPDALAAGPLANAAGIPILLTEPDRLPEITRITLDRGVEQVVVVGGRATIDDGVLARIGEVSGVEVVHRVSGADRAATAAELADLVREQLGWPAEHVAVSLGTDFPDALSLAPAAARMQAPILLTQSTDEVGAATFASVQASCDTLEGLTIAGGTGAVAPSAELQAELATACADHTVGLTGEEVVEDGQSAAGDLAATGTASVWVDSLCYAVRVQDLTSGPTAAHLHQGEAGADGQVVATLDVPSRASGDGLAVGCLTDEDIRNGTLGDLRAALAEEPETFYVDVHSQGHPDGALRGQLG